MIPQHTSQKNWNWKDWQCQVLIRLWTNWDSHTLSSHFVKHVDSYKIKCTFILWPSLSELSPRTNEHVWPHKDSWMNVFGGFAHSGPRLERLWMSPNRHMDAQIMVYSSRGQHSSTGRNTPLIQATTQVNWKDHVLTKRSQTQDYTHCMILCKWNS